MAGNLDGKVMVVGGDGVERECALAYAREGSGIAVFENQLDAAQCTADALGAPDGGRERARAATSSRTQPNSCSPRKPGSPEVAFCRFAAELRLATFDQERR
jgi:hypothetical protein